MNDILNSRRFHLHGDNIVECERIFGLITTALRTEFAVKVTGPSGSLSCPTFTIEIEETKTALTFTYFPGYGRWDGNILTHLKNLGVSLREAADIILTEVIGKREMPVFALEFSGALPAGNQAWQRSGRAYAVAKGHVPYIYLTELGGFELSAERENKAARLPNPAVPFSYLSYSLTSDTPVLPVYISSPVASKTALKLFDSIFGLSELIIFVKELILGRDYAETVKKLEIKVLNLVLLLANSRRRADSLNAEQWRGVYRALVNNQSITEHLIESATPLDWSKTAYIAGLTKSAKDLMAIAAAHAVGLTATNLPFCIISPKNRNTFADETLKLYPHLSPEFVQWLRADRPLTICWVMGFKPRGDDARPDRGLPGFTRMLIGETEDMLTIVYGPAPAVTWKNIQENPRRLMHSNGLWETILASSDAVLADSSTLGAFPVRNYLKSHWTAEAVALEITDLLVTAIPSSFGENDVDTVIHLLFHHLGERAVFEGLCNPPGGDWSGISLQNIHRTLEARWLSLPRVSGEEAKRPDHILQLFGLGDAPLILTIESKDRAGDVENNIGSRLIRYVAELVKYAPNAERTKQDNIWTDTVSSFDGSPFQYASAAAFVLKNPAEMDSVREKANCDLILGFVFAAKGDACDLHVLASSAAGRSIKEFIKQITKGSPINVIEV
jgi:hypothetical protein